MIRPLAQIIYHHLLLVPVEMNTQVLVSREKALVQVVQLVVVLHQQLQTGLVPAGRAHRLTPPTTKQNPETF